LQCKKLEASQKIVTHGCPACRVFFVYPTATNKLDGVRAAEASPPRLRCPRCAPVEEELD
jgi:hypothetical protein